MRDLEKGERWGIWRNGENEGFGGMGRMRDLEAGENEGFREMGRMGYLEVGENEVLRGGRKMRDFEEGGEWKI